MDTRVTLVSNGYRFLVHDNYLMFYYYVKEENTVYVNAVFNAKRDYNRVMKSLFNTQRNYFQILSAMADVFHMPFRR